MPQAIVGVIGYVAGYFAASAAVSYAVSLIGTLALSMTQKRKQERTARAQFDAAQVDRIANVPSAIAPRELVMGVVRKGGTPVFKTSVGQYKELFIICIAVAAHEIDAIERVYLNDQPVDINEAGQVTTAPYGQAANLDANDVLSAANATLSRTPVADSVKITREFFGGIGVTEVTGFTVSGNQVTITEEFRPGLIYRAYYQYSGFNSFVNIRWHLGSPDQTADGAMTAMLPGIWTWEHRLRGIAYLVCSFAYNDGALPSGIPNVTVRMRGAKIYDPRDGVTRYTENPALMMRHVITHPQFGKRTAMTAAEDARIIAAANACDTPNDYGSGVYPLFRASTVALFGGVPRDVLDDLAQSMGGEWAYAGGQFYVRAGAYQLPVMTLTEADLAVVQRTNDGATSQSAITISPHRPRNEKVNMVAIRIWDEAANFVETPIAPFRADALVAADGAELSQEVPMAAVFYAPQAYHIAGIMLRDARDPMTITLPFKMRAYQLELFDGVTLTIPRYGLAAKEFRILERKFSDGLVYLTLKETTAAIFAYGAGFVPGGYAPNTGLPNPWEIVPPTLVSASSGEGELVVQSDGTIVNGVRVAWTPIADQSIINGGSVELQYRVLPDGAWISVTAPGDASEVRFTGVEDLAMILIRLRSRNGLATSVWGTQVLHQVIGKTEPPPDILNLSISGSVLSWSLPRRVPDLAGFVFRFHYGQNLDWNSAAPLHDGLITASPWEPEMRPGGVVTIMGKAQDTSGNQSLQPGAVVMSLGDPPIANVVETWNYQALGWPVESSESSGWSMVSGNPTADPRDSFYGSDTQAFYAGDTDPFFKAEAYAEMIYVTPLLSIASALAGSKMTLIAQAQGVDLRIDYRFAGLGVFYGPDSDSFFGADADSFFGDAGDWTPWPGQLVVQNDVYQFRVTIGAGATQGILQELAVTVDAPDIEDRINDLVVPAGGVLIPYTKAFTKIVNIQITLQVNASSAVTARSTKTPNLSPRVTAYNAADASVGGASVDLIVKGW